MLSGTDFSVIVTALPIRINCGRRAVALLEQSQLDKSLWELYLEARLVMAQ